MAGNGHAGVVGDKAAAQFAAVPQQGLAPPRRELRSGNALKDSIEPA